MKLLILGGTGFLGPDVVEAAVRGKHEVTLFNRGRTNPGLFPDVEKLQGDRDADLKALEGRAWDAVVDVHASLPKWVRATCELLAKSCKSYLFVSTISVFNDNSVVGLTEDGPTYADDPTLDDLPADKLSNELYGPMKVRCESLVRTHFPRTATVVRPGLIVGPDDPTDRFTYWPARLDRGGEVLCPKTDGQHAQYVDSRDLGAFIVKLLEDGHAGNYNATGPSSPMTLDGLIHGCRAATATDATMTWVDEAWLLEQGVGPFMELPMWVPGPEMAGFMRVDCGKAHSVGLRHRPLAETAADTMKWWRALPEQRRARPRAGLRPEKEREVLKAWKERKGAGGDGR